MSTAEEFSTGTRLGDAVVADHLRPAGSRPARRLMFMPAADFEALEKEVGALRKLVKAQDDLINVQKKVIAQVDDIVASHRKMRDVSISFEALCKRYASLLKQEA